ncbi:hypothetical protein Dimus_000349 [Dionaea muscipula]
MAAALLSSSPPILKREKISRILQIADTASWYCSIVIAALILFSILIRDVVDDGEEHGLTSSSSSSTTTSFSSSSYSYSYSGDEINIKGGAMVGQRPCDEIYVVGEGETLHTISDKCGDPYIVERNPHIQDPDDVFPGLVIKITPSPSKTRKLMFKAR